MVRSGMFHLLTTAAHLRALAREAENPLQAAELLELAKDFDQEFERCTFRRSGHDREHEFRS
jgi:hypothetical protein